MLSQQVETGKFHVIAYVSQSLYPSERSVCNYRSVKLELLVLKWAVMEKFCDYLLGLKFHAYMDNSPLAYVRESKLGTSHIWWLSEFALFDYTIHYQTGRSNKAANALSRCPHDDDSIIKSGSDSDEVEVISYSSVCEVVKSYLETTKILDDLKKEALSISCAINQLLRRKMQRKLRVC